MKREVTGEHPGPLADHVVSVCKTPHFKPVTLTGGVCYVTAEKQRRIAPRVGDSVGEISQDLLTRLK